MVMVGKEQQFQESVFRILRGLPEPQLLWREFALAMEFSLNKPVISGASVATHAE